MNNNKISILDYKNKSNKYFHKLKGGVDHTHKYFSLITDKIIYDNCEQPDFIRVLQHPISKKIIILLGETHSVSNYRVTKKRLDDNIFDRINPEKGVDFILGQISKRINNAKDNLSNPFHKVLLLYEMNPDNILLGGGEELNPEPDLLEEYKQSNSLKYISSKFYKIFSKYKNVLKNAVDIRTTLGFDYCYDILIQQIIPMIKEDNPDLSHKDIFSKINDLFQISLNNIKNYIIQDQQIINKNFNLPFGSVENKKFFGQSYTRKAEFYPRRLSEVFITTQKLYLKLKELFIEVFNEYNKNPNILINSAFDYLNNDDRLNLFYTNIFGFRPLITRIMDLYIIEYINLMEDNTTTVVYTGTAHSRFLFNELIVFEDYEILEIENKMGIEKIGSPITCEKVFPSFNTNIDKLNYNYKNIKYMYEDEQDDNLKNTFIKNMLLIDITDLIPTITNTERQLGLWEDIMTIDPIKLFLSDIPNN